jgi:hypothetical protein
MSDIEVNLGGGRVVVQVGDGEPEVIDYEFGFEDEPDRCCAEHCPECCEGCAQEERE